IQGQTTSSQFTPAAALSQAVYTGTVEGTVARLSAELTIEALARPEDSLEVHLPFEGASIETASVDGATASLAALDEKPGVKALLRGEGKRVVRLKLAIPLGADGAAKRLDFKAPRAAASSFVLSVPEEVDLTPDGESLPATVNINGGKSEIHAS